MLMVVGLASGLVLAGAALLGVEALVASRGRAAPAVPSGIDGCLGCASAGPAASSGVPAPPGPDGPPAQAPLRTVWLGDSTAAGVGAVGADGVVGRQVARRLGRPVDVRVLAQSGAVLADVVAEQGPRVGADAQVVFVSVGANDTTHLTSVGRFSSSYRKLLAGLPPSACVVLLGVPDMGSAPRLAQPLRAVAGWRGRALDRTVRSLARGAGATYVDLAGATGPAFRRDRSLFAADGYHPADAGYGLWAAAVTSAMKASGVPGPRCP